MHLFILVIVIAVIIAIVIIVVVIVTITVVILVITLVFEIFILQIVFFCILSYISKEFWSDRFSTRISSTSFDDRDLNLRLV